MSRDEKVIGVPQLLGMVLRLAFALFVLSIPVFGMWTASSLAAFLGGPRWGAILVALFFFPVAPLAWDAWANIRKRRRGDNRRPYLRPGDRILLRTLFLNLAFIGGMLYAQPKSIFTALSGRGDWMLDGRHSDLAEKARSLIFSTADRVEWLYTLTHENMYAVPDENPDAGVSTPDSWPDSGVLFYNPNPDAGLVTYPDATQPSPEYPADASIPEFPDAGFEVPHEELDAGLEAPDAGFEPTPIPDERPSIAAAPWPTDPTPVLFATTVPPEAETSLTAVAKYLASQSRDDFEKAKAIHDYIALKVSYDHQALARGDYPPQDPSTVFRTKTAVCAGYSRLFVAMTGAVGLESHYIVGDTRDENSDIAGDGHAWSSVKIGGRDHLVDVTWDSPNSNVPEKAKNLRFRTDYLFTPPEVFGLDHFPEQTKWQLRENPLSRGEFIRQPMTSAAFHRAKLTLVNPDRSQITTHGTFEIEVENPTRKDLSADFLERGQDQMDLSVRHDCDPATYAAGRAKIVCRFPKVGAFQVLLFAGPKDARTLSFVGQFAVVNAADS